jgi:hypothetical protein
MEWQVDKNAEYHLCSQIKTRCFDVVLALPSRVLIANDGDPFDLL